MILWPRRARRTLLALSAFAAGCATAPPMPEPPATHPASPNATAAPAPEPSTTLSMPVRTPQRSDGQKDGGKAKRGH